MPSEKDLLNFNKPGCAAGGSVSAYDPAVVVDALANQVLEGFAHG